RLPALRPGTKRNLPIGSSLSGGALSGFGTAHHPLLSFRSSLAHWSDHPGLSPNPPIHGERVGGSGLGLRVPTSLDGLRAGGNPEWSPSAPDVAVQLRPSVV